MAEMSLTIGTYDFYPTHAMGKIGNSGDGIFYGLIEGGPSAATVKFIVGAVKGCFAPTATENAAGLMLVVNAGEGRFRSFLS
jgi:hypothetical protein